MATCPHGHASSATDYCDVCGQPLGAPPVAADSPAGGTAAAGTAGGRPCPSCGTVGVPEALFCESCGYDFTTGTPPRPAGANPPAEATGQNPATSTLDIPAGPPAGPGQPADGAPATPGAAPESAPADPAAANPSESIAAEWVVEVWIDPDWYALQNSPDPMPSPGLPTVLALRHRSLLVGRVSRSRNIHPDLDCTTDTGVSRRQAQLSTDGTRWFVEDLDSANGTYVAPAAGPLPSRPITAGQRVQLDADDRVYLGAWTRLVLRPITDEEREELA